jgi:type II secretory pathway pseudopilin PulG
MREKGQSLFELVVAITVIGVSLLAIVSLISSSIASSTLARDRSLATRYTQETLEWVRGQRDTSWIVFQGRAPAAGRQYCLSTLSWSAGCGYIANTGFTRTIFLQLQVNGTVEVTVTTMWSGSGGQHETRASTILSEW